MWGPLSGHTYCVRLLIMMEGASKDAEDNYRMTALLCAAHNGHTGGHGLHLMNWRSIESIQGPRVPQLHQDKYRHVHASSAVSASRRARN
jgi:hypothetical protein